ncbi:MAG: trypsin-like peptidase domain-containing protein [Minisyncoccales bacterium]
MLKRIFFIIVVFVIGMVGGIFADQIFWPYFIERSLFYQYNLEQQPIYLTEEKEIYIQENVALTETIEKVKKSVVGVVAKTKNGQILRGSGLIVTTDGLMITLAELVPPGSDFSFYLNNKKVSFQILKRDWNQNLALVKISDSALTTLGFADLENLKIGERVLLIGMVCEKENCAPVANEGIIKSFNENFLQTNIRDDLTLAGSPLFNIKGEVLGINSFDTNGALIAIPNSQIKKFLNL